MITPQELRIGSIVHYLIKDELDERKQYYDYNHIDWQDLKECVEDNETFNKWHKPVPLTGEILLKNFENWGIVSVNEYEHYQRWVIHNIVDGTGNFEVHIIKSTYGGSNITEIICSIDGDRIHTLYDMEYLHQLQNIFFTALGFELEINL